MTVVVVAEKPSVARDIAKVLGAHGRGQGFQQGGGYLVTWAVGHLVRLTNPDEIRPEWRAWRRDLLPMLPGEWPLMVIEQTREQFDAITGLLARPDVTEVVCATDAGREGELIFRLIAQAAALRKPVKRLWISSLTPEAIRSGFANLRDAREYDALADAARGRAQADWLVGMNLSRLYTLQQGDTFSVGRVQTPTLALLVAREKAIRDFVPLDYCEVVATFGEPMSSYKGRWFDTAVTELNERKRLPADGERAAAIVARVRAASVGEIVSRQGETKRMPPPLLYDLTELQRHANRLYGYSADRTLKIAQSLYESKKLLSYPRTDSRHLSTDMAATLPDVVAAIAPRYAGLLADGTGERALSRRFVDDTKVSDHHAIIPTTVDASRVAFSDDERKVYDLVCRRLLSAWHGDHVWQVTTLVTVVTSPEARDHFTTTGTAVIEAGWKVLDLQSSKRRTPGGDVDDEEALPAALNEGSSHPVVDVVSERKQTKPPKPLTDASLLSAMETAGKLVDDKELSQAMKDCGLGTPATRAAIIETLITREYVVREAKTLRATPKGIHLIDAVHPDVASPAMTGEWEARLRQIQRGQAPLADFMRDIERYVREVCGMTPVAPVTPSGGGWAPNGSGPRSPSGAPPNGGGAWSPTGSGARSPSGGPQNGGGDVSPNGFGSRSPSAASPGGGAGWSPSGGASRSSTVASSPRAKTRPASLIGAVAPRAASEIAIAPRQAPTLARRAYHEAPAADVAAAPAVVEVTHNREQWPHGTLNALLFEVFGHREFRQHQEEVCQAVRDGGDALLVMPTGAGKSLCYQLPGLALGGTTLVVSPLIALMEDQVAKLQALGLRAERIHSGRSRLESREVCKQYLAGMLDFLYIAPERLGVPGFPELLARRKPTLVAIDEAHCISQWGHDFRPDYRMLGERLPMLRPAPVIAVTATATPLVQDDIATQLGLAGSRRFIHGFRRTNIAIEVVEVPKPQRMRVILETLRDPGRRPAIVYAPTRDSAMEMAELLAPHMKAAAYHAGMTANVRENVQNAFVSRAVDVVVATVAFGMGIDKANIRTVAHLALPQTVEGYYQEIGRAGRDGAPSRALLLHSYVDRKSHEFFRELSYPEPTMLQTIFSRLSDAGEDRESLKRRTRLKADDFDRALEKLWIHGGARVGSDDRVSLGSADWQAPYERQRAHRIEQEQQIAAFAEGRGCRMVHLVRHFGDQQDTGTACGQCDACQPTTCLVQQSLAPTLDQQAHMRHIVSVIGHKPRLAVGALFRDQMSVRGLSRDDFEALIAGLTRARVLALEDDVFEKEGKRISFQRLRLDDTMVDLATVRIPSAFVGDSDQKKGRKKKKPRRGARANDDAVETPLAVALRQWRLSEARKGAVPAFRIMTDRTLQAVADARPADDATLLAISGVGPSLLKKYGAGILSIVASNTH